ncbi:MAG: STAS domain-containing protein [Phycisphaerae bacterium]|nr:STAS domain-containing protein [Phycisphaerae bacterium]
MEPARAHLDVQRQDGVVVVSFLDRKILDELNITRIEEELFQLVDSQRSIRLVLDFANVEHLSSRALGTLISLMKRVRGQTGALALCNIAARIFDVFKITRLDRSFDIFPACDQAVAALSGKKGPATA